MNAVVKQLEQVLDEDKQPKNPMRPRQVEEANSEIERLEAIAKGPEYIGASKGYAIKRMRELKKMITEQAPHEPDPSRKDTIHRLQKQVLEDVIIPNMLPYATLRRNPPGALDAYRGGEGSKNGKHAILVWKRANAALNHDNRDMHDLLNVERFRPPGGPEGTTTDAQIYGVHAMSSAAKANWPEALPEQGTASSPLSQARKREKMDKDVLAKQRSERMKARWAARKAAKVPEPAELSGSPDSSAS